MSRAPAKSSAFASRAAWLLFPHQMSFHIEHHLYPSVPHDRLPECHRALVAAGALDDAEVMPSLRRTLGKIFAAPTAPYKS